MVHLGKGYALFGFGFWFKEKDNSVVLRFDSFHSKRPPGYFLPWEVFHFVKILKFEKGGGNLLPYPFKDIF